MGWFSTLGSSLNLASLSCASPYASNVMCKLVSLYVDQLSCSLRRCEVHFSVRLLLLSEGSYNRTNSWQYVIIKVHGKTLLKSILLRLKSVRYSVVFAVLLFCGKICFNLLFYFLLNDCPSSNILILSVIEIVMILSRPTRARPTQKQLEHLLQNNCRSYMYDSATERRAGDSLKNRGCCSR